MTPEFPPAPLRTRVSGNADVGTYLQVGADSAAILVETARSVAVRQVIDVLDWGCGPGRVSAHIPNFYPYIRLRGCDPDEEAIQWASEHIRGRFAVSELDPPLPYEEESFDAVFGLSVMTHLRKDCQLEWLNEIARVLRPGGVLLATVHGKEAARHFGLLSVKGIEDHYLDPFMAGVLPADYYRTVLQTEEYTREAWGKSDLEIIAYAESVIGRHDLVVLGKPPRVD